MTDDRNDKPEEGPLNDVARAIGTKLGQAKGQADQVIEGMKAMAKAGAEAYVRRAKKKKPVTRAKGASAKSTSARGRAGTRNAGTKKSSRKKSR